MGGTQRHAPSMCGYPLSIPGSHDVGAPYEPAQPAVYPKRKRLGLKVTPIRERKRARKAPFDGLGHGFIAGAGRQYYRTELAYIKGLRGALGLSPSAL